ncbi:MAG TPA: multicopper oxidase domain-containing protein [Gemmatimonadaceae bacterium]|nr:multicopper oxidase domain-containing protein [Gemmatimonadaceae bacterium]
MLPFIRRPPAGDRCEGLPPAPAPRAKSNDNRTPAGVRRGDTLVLSLVAAPAAWYPEAETGCALPVLAFAEAGKQPSVPGPLVRVRAGTVMRVSVRNAAGRTLWVRGLHDRPSRVREGVELAPDSMREFSFTATAAGTYAYGATLQPFPEGGPTVRPMREDGQLVGAFVVDPADAPTTEPRDRVLVLTRWTVRDSGDRIGPPVFALTAVNGRSWPYTQRIVHAEGDSVHWRVLNASAAPHPMHLHGFYFRVDARGTLTGDTLLAKPRTVVTELLVPGQTMRMSWLAERPGNWLFHCHILEHMSARQRLDRIPAQASALLGVPAVARGEDAAEHSGHHQLAYASHSNHATDGMAGLIIGVLVTPAPGAPSHASPRARADVGPRRALRLFANQRASRYGFVLQEGGHEPARDSVRAPGSPIVLTRGEPVQITVFNRLTMPLSVHWHGLELESFFDGVGDWSGSAGSIAPPIAPGDSFVVRLTPPRAGTFMYHVHGEDGHELAAGLYAPLIVVEGPPVLDTLAERVLLVSNASARGEDGVVVNGSSSPRITLTAGRTHRLRMIGITSGFPADLAIRRGADTLRWRLLARDGAELTGAPEPLTPALRRVGAGMTADYEFLAPAEPGELTLHVRTGTLNLRPGLPGYFIREWSVPITVVPPSR